MICRDPCAPPLSPVPLHGGAITVLVLCKASAALRACELGDRQFSLPPEPDACILIHTFVPFAQNCKMTENERKLPSNRL